MRIPNTERWLYYRLQLDHFEPVVNRDLVRRSNWSPGYYGEYMPLLSPTLGPERVPHQEGGKTSDAQPSSEVERKVDEGQAGT